jgi:uncharacterized RDD family membrane protein YckC
LADPGRRLGARLLDLLLLLPVFALLLSVTLLIAAPDFGPIFPRLPVNDNGTSTVPTPGFVWVYLTVIGCFVATGMAMVVYETVATARYGRTLGKAWLHLRPVCLNDAPLGWGRSFGRAAIYWLFGFAGWIGLINPLWCLWDDKRQCLHDKVVGTLVINDGEPGEADVRPEAPAF